jgi:predicted RNA-binding Zn-ribbon protein involved in translation (DUF1610 family)
VTSSSDFGRPTNLSQGVEALRAKWGWIVALGIIYLLVGLLALYSVVTATIASVFVVGIMMLIAGVCAFLPMARKSFRYASATARNLLILSTRGISSMTDVDSNEIEFQCPSCGNDLKQTIGQLKAEKHVTCPGCGIGINIDSNRLANAAEEIRKAIEKSPPEITIKFFR